MAKSQFIIYLEYLPVRFFSFFINRLSHKWVLVLGSFFGFIFYYLIASARKVCFINLSIVYGEQLSFAKKKKIVLRSFRETGKTFFESFKFKSVSSNFFLKKTTFYGFEFLQQALKKKGAIVCSYHFSNWFWPVYALGYKLSTRANCIIRPLDNLLLNKLFYQNREYACFIARKQSLLPSFRALKNKEILGLMIDQNAAVGGVFIPIFGHEASTMRGPSFFYQKTKSPVFVCYDLRDGKGNHRVVVEEIKFKGEMVSDLKLLHRYFEGIIKQYPEQYFWMHPRWKKRSKEEESFYQGIRV